MLIYFLLVFKQKAANGTLANLPYRSRLLVNEWIGNQFILVPSRRNLNLYSNRRVVFTFASHNIMSTTVGTVHLLQPAL